MSQHTDTVRAYLLDLQERIISAFEVEDGKPFVRDAWVRGPEERLQGDGCSRLVEEGNVLERGGCNFSHVKGPQLPPSATQHRPELAGCPFEAMGVSLVFHPRSPHVPTVHMNVRMLAAHRPDGSVVAWYGGGMDLTPYYGREEDARHFHQACKDALAPFGPELHPRYKAWCDEYFFLKHRNEARGVGGIFFDDVSELGEQGGFELIRSVGDAFIGAYLPIRARLPGLSPGPLRRVQPRLGPRHLVRSAVGRPHRKHPDVDAAGGELALQLAPRARHARGTSLHRLPAAAGLGLSDLTPTAPLAAPEAFATPLRRVGIMGGSFDPVHVAHVALAESALQALSLDEVRWVPVGQPWQKARRLASAEHRVAMVERAIAHESRFVVDRVEVDRAGPSYTLETVRSLRQAHPDVSEWCLIIGLDQYLNLPSWRGWVELLGEVTLAVATRAGVTPVASPELAAQAHRMVPLPMAPHEVSSTDIRARLARGETPESLAPTLLSAGVARYIANHQLYAPGDPR